MRPARSTGPSGKGLGAARGRTIPLTTLSTEEIRAHATQPGAVEISVGLGSCCMAKGSAKLFHSLQSYAGQTAGKVAVKKSAVEAPKGTAGEGTYTAKHIIVATGARPRVLPGLEPDKKLVWTYFEAMVPERMPKSLLVVGSGAIGIEFASFYRTMGAEVTVIELLPQILPVEDAEIAGFARKQFEKQGIKIMTGAKVSKLDKQANGVTATIDVVVKRIIMRSFPNEKRKVSVPLAFFQPSVKAYGGFNKPFKGLLATQDVWLCGPGSSHSHSPSHNPARLPASG